MICECDACLEDVSAPPVGYVSERDWKHDMAWDACWQDGADFA